MRLIKRKKFKIILKKYKKSIIQLIIIITNKKVIIFSVNKKCRLQRSTIIM